MNFNDGVPHFQGFVQFRGNPSPSDCPFVVCVATVVIVLRLSTGKTEGEQKLIVEGNGQNRVIEFFWGEDCTFYDAEIGIVLGGDWLEIFGYYFGVAYREFCPFHPPRVKGYNVYVGQVLVVLAFDQKSGGVCPSPTKSLPRIQWFRNGRVVEEIFQLVIEFELPIKLVFPQLNNVEPGLFNFLN